MLQMNLVAAFICSSQPPGAATSGPLGTRSGYKRASWHPGSGVAGRRSRVPDSAERCADDKKPDCLTDDHHPKDVRVAIQLAGE